jgi:hypothetical protein
MAQTPTIESAILSRKERRMWGLDLDSWNIALVWSLAAAAIAAFAVVISTIAVIRLQKASEVETRMNLNGTNSKLASGLLRLMPARKRPR